jgi:hypothetical protein
MITPDEIRAKAERLYPEVLRAWLDGDKTFFPRVIPAEKRLAADDLAGAIQSIRLLRGESKSERGFGYTVEWREIRSRRFGQNLFPERILFETRGDLLRLIGRQREFDLFAATVDRLCSEFPVLDNWVRANGRSLVELAGELDGLLEVLRYFVAHPRPSVFARELPLSVDSKFVERHQGVLGGWFDLVLPPHTIWANESQFERRYGLHYAVRHRLIRLLDPALQDELCCPFVEFSLPLTELDELPVREARVFVVENKVNLLTFPNTARGIVLGGLGSAAIELCDIGWMHRNPLTYWGDLDVESFEILSGMRALFPHIESLLMGLDTLERFGDLCVPGNGGVGPPPAHLTTAEYEAFLRCRNLNLRLEQERLPQVFVETALALYLQNIHQNAR